MTSSQVLLARYAEGDSDEAFRELVVRHIDFVYGTASRLLAGDSHAAQDVAQMVFTDLARKSASIPAGVLTGWLHRHTCFVAAKFIRSEQRRRKREERAMQMSDEPDYSRENLAAITARLDVAINQLASDDRLAIILRYFDQLDFRVIASRLGSTEAAAQKRVSRAVEKLRSSLQNESGAVSAGLLAAALAQGTQAAAPAGLAISISHAAIAGAAARTTIGGAFLNMSVMSKAKMAVLGGFLAAGVASSVWYHRQSLSASEAEVARLKQQLVDIREDAARKIDALAKRDQAAALTRDQLSELMRLRGEAGQWRDRLKEMEMLLAREKALKPREAGNAETAPSVLPKENWSWAGYATPEAAFTTAVWALSKGDVQSFLNACTVEARSALEQDFAGKSENDIAESLREQIAGLEAIRLDRKKSVSEDKVSFTLVVHEQDNGSQRFRQEAVMTFVRSEPGGAWLYQP